MGAGQGLISVCSGAQPCVQPLPVELDLPNCGAVEAECNVIVMPMLLPSHVAHTAALASH